MASLRSSGERLDDRSSSTAHRCCCSGRSSTRSRTGPLAVALRVVKSSTESSRRCPWRCKRVAALDPPSLCPCTTLLRQSLACFATEASAARRKVVVLGTHSAPAAQLSCGGRSCACRDVKVLLRSACPAHDSVGADSGGTQRHRMRSDLRLCAFLAAQSRHCCLTPWFELGKTGALSSRFEGAREQSEHGADLRRCSNPTWRFQRGTSRARNSARADGSVCRQPSIDDVTMTALGLRTPRQPMHE